MGSAEFGERTILSSGTWYENLKELPEIIQETEATLCSWLKPEQKWEFRAYGLDARGVLNLGTDWHSMEFIFFASFPPVSEIKQMFGLRKRSTLDLSQIFDSEVVSAYSQSSWNDRELALKVQQVGPFPADSPPPYKPSDYQERYHVAKITVSPFYIYSNKERPYSKPYPYEVVDENTSRVIFEVLLKDQLSMVTCLARGRKEELASLDEELIELTSARNKILKERKKLNSFKAQAAQDEWEATLARISQVPTRRHLIP